VFLIQTCNINRGEVFDEDFGSPGANRDWTGSCFSLSSLPPEFLGQSYCGYELKEFNLPQLNPKATASMRDRRDSRRRQSNFHWRWLSPIANHKTIRTLESMITIRMIETIKISRAVVNPWKSILPWSNGPETVYIGPENGLKNEPWCNCQDGIWPLVSSTKSFGARTIHDSRNCPIQPRTDIIRHIAIFLIKSMQTALIYRAVKSQIETDVEHCAVKFIASCGRSFVFSGTNNFKLYSLIECFKVQGFPSKHGAACPDYYRRIIPTWT
jgi:hypothetical protein